MDRLELEAYITGPKTNDRVRQINRAVADRAILPVAGRSGSGKGRFFDWWRRGGCADLEFAEDILVKPEDIVFVNAQPGPVSSIPVGCVLFTRLWRELQEMERTTYYREPRRPLGRPKPCREADVVSVIDDNIAPLLDQLLPQAIVIGNAQHLDRRSLGHLLELRTPIHHTAPRIAMRSLVLYATVDSDNGEGTKFETLLSSIGETKAAWQNYRMSFALMEGFEFVEVMLRLLEQNLQATVAQNVDEEQMYEDFATWTTCNWWLVRELVIALDRTLGPRSSNRQRVITPKVIEQVRRSWLQRSPEVRE